MIKKITKYLHKKVNYELDVYLVFKPERKISKYRLISYILFLLITGLFIFDLIYEPVPYLNPITYFFAFFFLFAVPIATKTDKYRHECIIITPDLIIQRKTRKEFSVVFFNSINKLKHSHEYITIVEKEEEVELDLVEYAEILPSLIEVLEAKGKTFDKERAFMKRPVNILIENGKIYLEDIKQEETRLEKLTYSLSESYSAITPGYLDQILPRNAIIHDVYFENDDLYLGCSHFEIRENHPENITFGHIQVLDGVLVFMDAKVKTLTRKAGQERQIKFEPIEISQSNVIEQLENGVISEWKFKKNEADLIIASGIGKVRLTIDFSECLVGWKKEKE